MLILQTIYHKPYILGVQNVSERCMSSNNFERITAIKNYNLPIIIELPFLYITIVLQAPNDLPEDASNVFKYKPIFHCRIPYKILF